MQEAGTWNWELHHFFFFQILVHWNYKVGIILNTSMTTQLATRVLTLMLSCAHMSTELVYKSSNGTLFSADSRSNHAGHDVMQDLKGDEIFQTVLLCVLLCVFPSRDLKFRVSVWRMASVLSQLPSSRVLTPLAHKNPDSAWNHVSFPGCAPITVPCSLIPCSEGSIQRFRERDI